ncbi:hypothetical protein M0R45_031736 [Rubus argutus]|uniref:Uncharacterized protein n=1 Tax=Rubus argutus TaxID=59490 RepID=A0AAW1WI58_RUBAR
MVNESFPFLIALSFGRLLLSFSQGKSHFKMARLKALTFYRSGTFSVDVKYVAGSYFQLFSRRSLLFKLVPPSQGSDQPQSGDGHPNANFNSGSYENPADGNNEVPPEPMEPDKPDTPQALFVE